MAADISTCCRSVGPPLLLPPGHYDVQPAEDTAPLWTTPPFKPEVRFDRFWGRGVHDDKGSGVLPPLQVIPGCCTGWLPVAAPPAFGTRPRFACHRSQHC